HRNETRNDRDDGHVARKPEAIPRCVLIRRVQKWHEVETEWDLDDFAFVADAELDQLAALTRRDRHDPRGYVAERLLDPDHRAALHTPEVAAKHGAVIRVDHRACSREPGRDTADRPGFGKVGVDDVRTELAR